MITVIIPAYNVEKYISHSITSACTLKQVSQVIVIDDFSNDNTLKNAQELCKVFHNLLVMRHNGQKNRGASFTRNYGINLAENDLIAFLDADDFYLPNRFELTTAILDKNQDIDGVYEAIGIEFTNEKTKNFYINLHGAPKLTMTSRRIESEKLFEALIRGRNGYFSLDGLTIKKKAIGNKIRFDENLKMGEDTDFIWSLALNCRLQGGNLDKPVATRRIHGDNQILSSVDAAIGRERMVTKWMERLLSENISVKIGIPLFKRLVIARLAKKRKSPTIINKLKEVFLLILYQPRYVLVLLG